MKMNVQRFLAVGAVAILLVSVAVAQQGQSQQQRGQKTSDKDADRQFLMESIRTNLFEIEVGKHVQDNAKDPQVQQFAQTMVDYHTKANDKLQTLAQQMGVEAPRQMNEWQQAMVQYMQELNSPEFGRTYMFHQAGTHHIKLLNHRYVISHGSNQQVQQVAENMVPDLRDHLQRADRLADQMAGGSTQTARRSGSN